MTRVACIGDSITFGHGIEDRAKNSYPAQLGVMLGKGYEVANFGANRSTLLKKGDFPFWRFVEFKGALDYRPDIVIIKLGTNDTKPENWRHKADFEQDYGELVRIFQGLDSKPAVWICYPVPVFPERWGVNDKTVREEVIPLIDRVAKATGARVIDFYNALRGKPELFPDLLHPNAGGAKLIAETVFRAITGAVAQQAGPVNQPAAATMQIEDYHVIWDSPSTEARGSMPLGNGDLSLNAWVEAGGDLVFYIGKTDAWDDNNRLVKIGRVRLTLAPNPFATGGTFRQELCLRNGEMVVTAAAAGVPDAPVVIHLWADANRPVIQLSVESEQPVTATIASEIWRTTREPLAKLAISDIYDDHPGPPRDITIIEPDTILEDLPDGIGWYHRNTKSVGPELTMQFQGLMDAPWTEPLLHRTFGALIRAENGRRIDDRRLESPAGTRHRFSVYVLTRHPASAADWLAGVRDIARQAEALDWETRRMAHLAWWEAFWSRSHLHIRAGAAGSGDLSGHAVARGYNLQRFITACAGRGAYPIKFNGSTFVMPWPGHQGDADFRRWGPGYWWQNTRLPYASLCTTGDYDLMQPFFRMYAGEVLEVSKHRTKRYFGIEGAFYPEVIYPWGAVTMLGYGWEQPAAERTDKLQTSGWTKWEWVCGPELVFMMQDYHDHTQDDAFLRERLLPTARAVLGFFAGFYKTDAQGKLVMHPAQAAETWWNCTNPMPELAGLLAITARLLELPAGKLPSDERHMVEAFRKTLPDLPTREENGVRMLAPADKFEQKNNCENPELYAVFPFRVCSFEKPNAALGVQALLHRWDKGHCGWHQDDIFMAYLGLTEEAKANLVARAQTHDPACRFPAFWGPNADWTPDQDHGGVLMRATQALLMQTEGRRIFLLPAWPREWDADFKLHAPYNTVVEGSVRAGTLTALKVTPEERRQDVTVVGAP